MRRERDEMETIALPRQDVQGGTSNGTRGAEDRDAGGHGTRKNQKSPAVAGKTK